MKVKVKKWKQKGKQKLKKKSTSESESNNKSKCKKVKAQVKVKVKAQMKVKAKIKKWVSTYWQSASSIPSSMISLSLWQPPLSSKPYQISQSEKGSVSQVIFINV